MNLPAVENFTREVNNMMFPSFGMQLLSALVEFTGKLYHFCLFSILKYNRCLYSGALSFAETCF